MYRRLNNLKSMICAIVVLLSLTSCNAFKPDHPQAFQSFRDPRAPSQNKSVENSIVSSQKANKSQVNYEGDSLIQTGQDSKQEVLAVSNDVGPSASVTGGSVSKNPEDKSHQSFFHRFVGGFAKMFNKEQTTQTVAQSNNKWRPNENAALLEVTGEDSYYGPEDLGKISYFDLAEKVEPGKQVVSSTQQQNVKQSDDLKVSLVNEANAQEKVQSGDNTKVLSSPALAASQIPVIEPAQRPVKSVSNEVPTPQTPDPPTIDGDAISSMQNVEQKVNKVETVPAAVGSMVKVPEPPSLEQMKKEINKQEEPQLYKVPQIDQKAKVKQQEASITVRSASVAKQPVKKVVKHAKSKVEPSDMNYDNIHTEDNSQIVVEDGKHIATGFLRKKSAEDNGN